ncbi:PfkB family carbohydrate kinase [Kocuria oceani]|uniref:PfkB family carbohydrate kinase n=1 Tax=Kocuria oceani TaxID=988827 RepID=UPI0040363E76
MNTTTQTTDAFDVIVLGEILLEMATDAPFGHGVPAQLGVSGDALNVAAAAAAAGARVGLVAVLTDDELGAAITDRVRDLGISTELLRYRPGQQGVYLVHSDPEGQREFSYARTGSVGSTLSPADLDTKILAAAGAVIASGIACAISPTASAAVFAAAEAAQRFVYDPNYRPRLTGSEEAAATLTELAARSFLVTPSFPGETRTLLGTHTPYDAARALLSAGTELVAVTCGASGVHLQDDTSSWWIDAVPAPVVVDQTGAGDALVGTLTARLVLGDSFQDAAGFAAAAASLVVGGQGGTGLVPAFEQTLAHARTYTGGEQSSHA